VYCAPACGHGCTRKDYEAALFRAQRVADALGEAWKAEASENMGWHSKVRKAEVYICVPGSWGASQYMAGTEGRGILGTGRTARQAINVMVERLRMERSAAERILETVEATIQ